jgi:glyoxylate reductase
LFLSYSAREAWQDLANSSLAETTTASATSRAEFLAELRSGKHAGVVAICDRAPASFAQTGHRWDDELLDALPDSVKFICHMGAGYDSIDVAACTRRGIFVSNCPHVVDEATADCALFLILATLRGFNNGIMAIRNGTWLGATPPPPLGHDPQGKVLGILGLGGIGLTLRRKAEAFGMQVIYHNRKKIEGQGMPEYVGFDELLARSDVLSLNLPLNVSISWMENHPFPFPEPQIVHSLVPARVMLTSGTWFSGKHAQHHLGHGVCKDEKRDHHRQHCQRRCHG